MARGTAADIRARDSTPIKELVILAFAYLHFCVWPFGSWLGWPLSVCLFVYLFGRYGTSRERGRGAWVCVCVHVREGHGGERRSSGAFCSSRHSAGPSI